jgi:hypothetical protein
VQPSRRQKIITLVEQALQRYGESIMSFHSNRSASRGAQAALDHFFVSIIKKIFSFPEEDHHWDIIHWALRLRQRMLEGLISHDFAEVNELDAFWEDNPTVKTILAASLPALPQETELLQHHLNLQRRRIFTRVVSRLARFKEGNLPTPFIMATRLRPDNDQVYDCVIGLKEKTYSLSLTPWKPSAVIRLPAALLKLLAAYQLPALAMQWDGAWHRLRLSGPSRAFHLQTRSVFAINSTYPDYCLNHFDRVVIVADPTEPFGFGALPASREEAELIANHCTAQGVHNLQLLLGADAGAKEVVEAVDGTSTQILHLACHGIAGAGLPPELCGLVLAAANNDHAQALLTYYQILYLNLQSTGLVVLSCCRGALAPGEDGLAVQSVAFAFLKAGAKCVLASLENVNDEFTAVIMDKFYTGLFATRAPTEALRLTRLHFQENKTITRELAKWVIYV